MFLDISKAFDSVSHEVISKVCNRVGVPEIIHSYINHAYHKQGDPMSQILFNSVTDYATSKMADHNAVSINNDLGKIKFMAFADDLVIFGKNRDCLQDQLNIVMNGLRKCGLDINKSKCAAMNLIIHPKKKIWICSPYVLMIVKQTQ